MSHTMFTLARSSLLSYQSALNITGQNISNLNNPNYTRQVPRIVSNVLNNATNISKDLSMGVTLDDVQRMRDELLNSYFRTENMQYNDLEVTQKLYGEIEFIFNELGDFTLSDTISEFWTSWQSLQEMPEDLSLRQNILQVGGFLADSIRGKSDQLVTLGDSIAHDAELEIDQINNLLEQLKDINKNLIQSWNEVSTERNTLLDRKDMLIDDLTSRVDFQVVTQRDGSTMLYLNGTPMFYKEEFRTLQMNTDSSGIQFSLSTGEDVTLRSGKLHGYQDMHNSIIGTYQAELDSFASHLIEQVNTLHRNGYSKDDTSGLDFFTGTGASDIDTGVSDPLKVAAALGSLTSTSSINDSSLGIIDSLTDIASQSALFDVTPDIGTDPSGMGRFTINGVEFTWSTADSLQDIVNRINADPNAGVEATFNPELQKMQLVRDPTVGASATIIIQDIAGAGNFTDFTSLSSATLNTNSQGSGENALYISQLWHRKVIGTPPSWTINEEFNGLVNGVAKDKNLIDNLFTNKQKLVDNIKVQRQEEGTVSLDEEMINLMKYQQAYSACSRLVTVADEMLDRIINQTGHVGR